MRFCSPFDENVARSGPPAVFLPDDEGVWRLAVEWTQDAWLRRAGPHVSGWRYLLLRDRGTGYVQLVLTTASDLIEGHPRSDVRSYASLDEAVAARDAFGRPPIGQEAW